MINEADEFKAWEVSTKATLKRHKLLSIVDSSDPDPIPRNPNGTICAIPPALCARVTEWANDHERAREAIIHCLLNTELLKLVDVQDDVPMIWRSLHDEYGHSSNLEYVMTWHCSRRLTKHRWIIISIDLNSLSMTLTIVNTKRLMFNSAAAEQANGSISRRRLCPRKSRPNPLSHEDTMRTGCEILVHRTWNFRSLLSK